MLSVNFHLTWLQPSFVPTVFLMQRHMFYPCLSGHGFVLSFQVWFAGCADAFSCLLWTPTQWADTHVSVAVLFSFAKRFNFHAKSFAFYTFGLNKGIIMSAAGTLCYRRPDLYPPVFRGICLRTTPDGNRLGTPPLLRGTQRLVFSLIRETRLLSLCFKGLKTTPNGEFLWDTHLSRGIQWLVFPLMGDQTFIPPVSGGYAFRLPLRGMCLKALLFLSNGTFLPSREVRPFNPLLPGGHVLDYPLRVYF